MRWTLSSLAQLPPQVRQQALASLTPLETEALLYCWEAIGRPNQFFPADDACESGHWLYWLILSGRGWGKTRTGAEAVRKWIKDGSNYVNMIGATADDARDIMIEGESGILAICPRWERPVYVPSKRRLEWPNGARSLIFTADEPERLRGKQHEKIWADELAAWKYPEAWDQAKFGLRLGTDPRAVITTTPRPTKIVREIMADPDTHVTRGNTKDNAANLAQAFYNAVLKKYKGTRLGRQEIDGEVLDDNPSALFKRKFIDDFRVSKAPALSRIVIGVDPSASSNEDSAETGIIGAGIDAIGDPYVFCDASVRGRPEKWGKAVVAAYYDHNADRIVAEKNNGGDMVESVIRSIDKDVSIKLVTASRGKAIRAEPVSALYEQGKVHHVGCFPILEDQMCEWDPSDPTADSPDHMDALVWAITELSLNAPNTAVIDYLLGLKKDREQRERK